MNRSHGHAGDRNGSNAGGRLSRNFVSTIHREARSLLTAFGRRKEWPDTRVASQATAAMISIFWAWENFGFRFRAKNCTNRKLLIPYKITLVPGGGTADSAARRDLVVTVHS